MPVLCTARSSAVLQSRLAWHSHASQRTSTPLRRLLLHAACCWHRPAQQRWRAPEAGEHAARARASQRVGAAMRRRAPVRWPRLLACLLLAHACGGTSLEEMDALAVSLAASVPAPPAPVTDRMAAMVLLSQGAADADAARRLRCALQLLRLNVGGTTLVDVYVWLVGNATVAPSWLSKAPNTYVMRIPDAAWQLPSRLRPESTWVLQGTTVGYRLMGAWRLGFSFAFVRARGYAYLLQMDDDTFVHAPVADNLVALMRDNGYLIANRLHALNETREVTAGLPELAAYYLATRSLEPAGPLFAHCVPPDARGLHTLVPGAPQPNGWDAQSLAGNFNIFDIAFWFSPPVQDFVQLVWESRGCIEQRWNELGPQSMIRHLFVPDARFHTLTARIWHKKTRHFGVPFTRLARC